MNGAAGPPIAPHQAETLREVANETAAAETHSPRVSWNDGGGNGFGGALHQYTDAQDGDISDDMYHEEQDVSAIAQNGGVSSVDDDELDGDVDDDMDDDLMDKISSSPSIEDGGFHLGTTHEAWPQRESSLAALHGEVRQEACISPPPQLPKTTQGDQLCTLQG